MHLIYDSIFTASKIPYKLVLAILERHGMPVSSGNSNLNLMVPPFQLTSLLHDIYFACEKLGHFTKTQNYQLDTATALLANFFWNIYDPYVLPVLFICVSVFLSYCFAGNVGTPFHYWRSR